MTYSLQNCVKRRYGSDKVPNLVGLFVNLANTHRKHIWLYSSGVITLLAMYYVTSHVILIKVTTH